MSELFFFHFLSSKPNNFSLDEETSDELLELLSRDLNDSENPMFNDLESRNPLRTGNLDPGLKARSSCLDPSAMISLDQLHQSGEDFFPVDSSVVDIEFLEQDDDGTLIDSKTWSEDTLPRRFWRDDN